MLQEDTELADGNEGRLHAGLKSFVNDYPALFWRIETSRSRIEFLNSFTVDALGDQTTLFMKNSMFRKTLLVAEDQPLLDEFFDAVRERKTASIIFRIQPFSGNIVWLKLSGTACSADANLYHGILMEATDAVESVHKIKEEELKNTLRIHENNEPTLLVDLTTGTVRNANIPMKNLLGLKQRGELAAFNFFTILPEPLVGVLQEMTGRTPFAHCWKRGIDFQLLSGVVAAETELTFFEYLGDKLVRVVLTNPEQTAAPSRCDVSEVKSVLSLNIQDVTSIQNIMQSAATLPALEHVAQGIIFSDIHIRKKKVVVYFGGTMFDGIEQGEMHPFKGTIAEEITRFNHEYIVVDDTRDSIKPIDWALFIPRGVRSYYAKPFYVRGVLRTVFIVCSDTPDTFSDKTEESFDELLAPLADVVKVWRRSSKK